MDYLRLEEVVYCNRLITTKYGDTHSVLNPGNLESNLELMQLKYEKGKTKKEMVVWKAAFWLHRMASSGHAFCDGNKRTALVTTLSFLGRNGFYITKSGYTEQHEIFELVKEAAKNIKTLAQVVKWFENSVNEVTPSTVTQILLETKTQVRKHKFRAYVRQRYTPRIHRYKLPDAKQDLDRQFLQAKLEAITAVLNTMKKTKAG